MKCSWVSQASGFPGGEGEMAKTSSNTVPPRRRQRSGLPGREWHLEGSWEPVNPQTLGNSSPSAALASFQATERQYGCQPHLRPAPAGPRAFAQVIFFAEVGCALLPTWLPTLTLQVRWSFLTLPPRQHRWPYCRVTSPTEARARRCCSHRPGVQIFGQRVWSRVRLSLFSI